MRNPNVTTAGTGRVQALVLRFVVWRYVTAGLNWGDPASYESILGPCSDAYARFRRLKKWEARYEAMGFQPVSPTTWIKAGGFGCDYASELFRPQNA